MYWSALQDMKYSFENLVNTRPYFVLHLNYFNDTDLLLI